MNEKRCQECTNQVEGMQRSHVQKNYKALFLIKFDGTHIKLYCASRMWSFKMSNFIVFNFIYWGKKSSYFTICMHIYMYLGGHITGRLICFKTRYIYQVKICLRTYPILICVSFFFYLKLSRLARSLVYLHVHVFEITLVVFQLSYCIF